jgi:large subunit ribosomal protein L23
MAFNIFQKISGSKGGDRRAPRASTGSRASSERKDVVQGKDEAVEEQKVLTNDVVIKGDGSLLLIPHVSEKATMFATGSGKQGPVYVFRVSGESNKIAIKSAVESRYKVTVKTVRIVNLHGKVRRRGRAIGHQAGYKKAIVALPAGQVIEEF